MIIKFSSKFDKAYWNLSAENRYKVDKAISVFASNPFDVRIKNHGLKGNKKGVRSFSVAYDLRILYEQIDEHKIVLMLMVGTHA